MRAKFFILLLCCFPLGFGCASTQLQVSSADEQGAAWELGSVRDVCIFPIAYYTDQESLYERLGGTTAGLVEVEVRRRLAEGGLRVRDQDLTNRLLLSKGVVRDSGQELAFPPATVSYDLAYVEYSRPMKAMLLDYLENDAPRPEVQSRPLEIQTEPLLPELVAGLGKELGVALVIRGLVVLLGRPGMQPLDYEYSFIPGLMRNRDGVVVRAAYEKDMLPALSSDLDLGRRPFLARFWWAKYRAIQVRLLAQETEKGRVVWSNTAVILYPTLFESEVDLRAMQQRLTRAIAREVELLIGDLFSQGGGSEEGKPPV